MAKIVEKVRLICCEAETNNNKLWEGYLYDDDSVETRWGRVRDSLTLQSKMFPGAGRRFFDKKKSEKIGKGYTELKTVDNVDASTVNVPQSDLKDLACRQILKSSSPELEKLIDRLVKANVHRITSSTSIKFNNATGLFTTPLGIVTKDAIEEARKILADIERDISKEGKLKPLVSSYLRLIPHDIGTRFDVKNIFPDADAVKKENDILDSLEASFKALRKGSVVTQTAQQSAEERVFNVELNVVDGNSAVFQRLERWFNTSKKRMHSYDNVKVKNIYSIDIEENVKNFDAKNGNVVEVWHGTGIANVLSILKSGLKIAPPSTAAIAGKLFGNGVYGSQTSSKSLGYTFGRWGQGGGDMGYLFVCDFVMGKAYYPTSYGISSIPHGYDSCWALPEKTGLHNDELIVYSEKHFKIKYLLEVK